MTSTAISSEDKILYTARTRTTGGRDGQSRSDDGRLDVKLDSPGGPGTRTNPEQLFAAGWSACFESAMGIVARKRRLTLPADTTIDAEVDLRNGETGYSLAARMTVNIPGVDREIAQAIVGEAHQTSSTLRYFILRPTNRLRWTTHLLALHRLCKRPAPTVTCAFSEVAARAEAGRASNAVGDSEARPNGESCRLGERPAPAVC